MNIVADTDTIRLMGNNLGYLYTFGTDFHPTISKKARKRFFRRDWT
jgi:hypothetical protein